jgi:hypothetical protein
MFVIGELENNVFSLSCLTCLMSVDKNLVFSMSCFDVLFLGGFWGFLQLNKHTEQTIVAQPELFVELENKQ